MHGKSDTQCNSHKGKMTYALVQSAYVKHINKKFIQWLDVQLRNNIWLPPTKPLSLTIIQVAISNLPHP